MKSTAPIPEFQPLLSLNSKHLIARTMASPTGHVSSCFQLLQWCHFNFTGWMILTRISPCILGEKLKKKKSWTKSRYATSQQRPHVSNTTSKYSLQLWSDSVPTFCSVPTTEVSRAEDVTRKEGIKIHKEIDYESRMAETTRKTAALKGK